MILDWPMTAKTDGNETPMKQQLIRTSVLTVLLTCFLLPLVSNVTVDGQQTASKPNVVLFLVDDMGWMDSTPYGSQYYETPNMARLERRAMRFTDAYAVPLCSPTRASILSGQYSSRHRVTSATGHRPANHGEASPYPDNGPADKPLIYARSKNYLDPNLMTLAEVLHSSGYRTGHFGKWHLGLSREHWPEAHGFEVAFHAEPSPGPKSYFSPYGIEREGEAGPRRHVGTITDGPDGEYITDRLTDEAIQFMEEHQNEPFFLNFWHYAVHGPWGHKEEYTQRFAEKTDPRGQQDNPIMGSMLKSVDESLGRILDKLDELELTDNTLFIFYSDNGGNVHSNIPGSRQIANIKPGHPKWEFVQDWQRWAGDQPPTNNAPLREGKGRIYEGGQRVPLMVSWSGQIEAGSVSAAIVGPIDLYPTILEAVGIAPPTDHIVDGESLLPILNQTGELSRSAYFTWFPHLVPAVSVRQGDWKLIRRFEPNAKYPERLELYNLRDDIGESFNLAGTNPDQVALLDELIDQFIEDTGALAPKPNPRFHSAKQPSNDDANPLDGLVPRQCKVVRSEGAIQIIGTGRNPFLGTAQVRLQGPLTLNLRVRSSTGGEGRVHWRTADQEAFPESTQIVSFEIPSGKEWQDVSVPLPIERMARLIRIYLPAQEEVVEVKSIEFQDNLGGAKTWNFTE